MGFGRAGPGSRVTVGNASGGSNSVTGLMDDVIMHTIDYRVEFVDAGSNDEIASAIPRNSTSTRGTRPQHSPRTDHFAFTTESQIGVAR